MNLSTTTLRATGLLGITCSVLAVATVWLVFTEPVTVARAVQEGDIASLFEVVANAIGDAVRVAARYL